MAKETKQEAPRELKMEDVRFEATWVQEDLFEPVLGELVADDAFAFTLLSCHC